MDNIYLTLDLDWACDEVWTFIEKEDLKCTFFITHQTPLLTRVRATPNIEPGIHLAVASGDRTSAE